MALVTTQEVVALSTYMSDKVLTSMLNNKASKEHVYTYLCLFSALGAAYGTAKSGTGIAAMSVMRPELIMKSIIPVVMAGIIAIYGLVVAALIANSIDADYDLFK